MAKSEKRSARKANAVATDESIALQTAEFLKSGGKIQQIPTGISGQSNSGPKHISLRNKSTEVSKEPAKAVSEK